MHRQNTYKLKLNKVVHIAPRTARSFYVHLITAKPPMHHFSRLMRPDEDNFDQLTIQGKVSTVEIWEYEGMYRVGLWEMGTANMYKWAVFQENVELTVERENQWEKKKEKENLTGTPLENNHVNQAKVSIANQIVFATNPAISLQSPPALSFTQRPLPTETLRFSTPRPTQTQLFSLAQIPLPSPGSSTLVKSSKPGIIKSSHLKSPSQFRQMKKSSAATNATIDEKGSRDVAEQYGL